MKAVRSSSSPPEKPDRLIRALINILFALSLTLVVLRFVNLNYDSPLFYSGYSASEISDPYMYTSFARNKVLFDDWDPYNYSRWDSWKLSIVSGVSYLVFLAGGVSRVSANVGALALQLGGFLFFMLALARYRPRLEVALGAFLLLATSGLFFSGRIPLLENGVIFLSGLTVWLYFRYSERLWGVALAGAFVSVIALAAKLNGVALLAPLLIDTIFRNSSTGSRSKKYRFGGALLAGFILCGIAYSLLVYQRAPLVLLDYFHNQTAAVGLTPTIPNSIGGLFATILLYGSQNGLFRFQPVFLILTGMGLILVALRIATGRMALKNNSDRFLFFVGVWFTIGLVIILPYSYRPSRYFMPLTLPAAALAAYALSAALRGAFVKSFKLTPLTLKNGIVLLFCSLVIVYLSVQTESAWRQFVIAGKSIITPLNPTGVGVGIVLSVILVFESLRGFRVKKVISVSLALLALATLTLRQTDLLYAGLSAPRDPLHVQVQDVGDLLGPEAVLAGTFGPAFTIDNGLRNLIHPFSAKLYERDFFSRFPVTHVAVAPSEMKIAKKRYPELKNAHSVTQLWSRDGSFVIYRVPGVEHKKGYEETEYERGMDFLAIPDLDSALVHFDRFLEKHPKSFRGRWAKARTLANQVRVKPTVAVLEELSQDYQDYYFAHFLVGREYVTLYRFTRGSEYKNRALSEYLRTQELNPHVSPPQSDMP